MRNTSFAFLLMLFTLFKANAQQLNNSGFENWDTLGDYTQPSYWYTLNPLISFGFEPSTTITTDAHTGNFAVLLTSKSAVFADYSGVICTGPVLNDGLQPDFSNLKIPFSGAPKQFKFYYKSLPKPTDKAALGVYLTKWNEDTQQSDTIAEAGFEFADSVTQYTEAIVDFIYYQKVFPDSMFLIASSSVDGFNPVVGSKLWLDDFEFIYPTSGVNNGYTFDAQIYPNPVEQNLYLKLSHTTNTKVYAYNQLGVLVYVDDFKDNSSSINTTGWASGLYTIHCVDLNTQQVFRKKIIKQH